MKVGSASGILVILEASFFIASFRILVTSFCENGVIEIYIIEKVEWYNDKKTRENDIKSSKKRDVVDANK